MTRRYVEPRCVQTELVTALALGVLPADEVTAIRAHVAGCIACQAELASLQSVVEALPAWPGQSLQPSPRLWTRLAERMSRQEGQALPASCGELDEPVWVNVAPGIACKILASDPAAHRVSMLVRLDPGAAYPPHIHAGIEELHLLDGELWIDDRKLAPGDYNRAEPGTRDQRVWSETGCTCFLTTSTQDRLL